MKHIKFLKKQLKTYIIIYGVLWKVNVLDVSKLFFMIKYAFKLNLEFFLNLLIINTLKTYICIN